MITTHQADIHHLLTLLNEQPIVVVDTETTGLRPFHGDKLIGISYYFPPTEESFYIPFRHAEGENAAMVWLDELRKAHRVAGERKQCQIFFNAKFDLHFLHADGFSDPYQVEDVMLAAHLLNENEELSNGKGIPNVVGWRPQRKGAYTLKRLARKYIGETGDAAERELERQAGLRGLDAKAEMWKLPPDIVAPYAEDDVINTWRLREFYMPGLQRWGMVSLYENRNAFLLHGLLQMERNGMYVNADVILQHQAQAEPKAAALANDFEEEAQLIGLNYQPFNPGSPTQVKAFFNLRGYHLSTTQAVVIQAMSDAGDEWAKKLLEYRRLLKVNGTYYEPYLRYQDTNGVIHPSIHATGTVTGRLSSSDPNFQNIPRVGTSPVKEIFQPRDGRALVEVDYKMLEFILAAHYAQEKNARAFINSGEDVHAQTGERIFLGGKPIGRQKGKTANFSFLYGMGEETGALRLRSSVEDAKDIIDGWHALFPGFRRAANSAQHLAKQYRHPDGTPGGPYQFIRMENGRVRHFQEYWKYPFWDEHVAHKVKREPPFYRAWNVLIQGTAGGMITETSILRLGQMFNGGDDVRLLMTVHDSIIFEVKRDRLEKVLPVIREVMTDWPQFNPQLKVDIKVGEKNWLDMYEWES